jgi:uncharacterized protein YuzE
MMLKYSPTADALYLRLRPGEISNTVEWFPDDDIYLDLDADGRVLGVEFVNAGDFLTVLARHDGQLEIPDRIEDIAAA